MVVSELVGNAIRHGCPPITYDVSVDGPDLVVSVHDSDPRPPGDRQGREPGAENGRGAVAGRCAVPAVGVVARAARQAGLGPALTHRSTVVRDGEHPQLRMEPRARPPDLPSGGVTVRGQQG